MDFLSHPETWQTLVPRMVAYTLLGTFVAWSIHLLEPAWSAAVSSKYKGVTWVKGDRGLLQFFSIAYDCIFHSGGLFVAAYEKVSKSSLWTDQCLTPVIDSSHGQ